VRSHNKVCLSLRTFRRR